MVLREYRPDIDGLRAVAVLSVILFHAGISGFSGGYVGVDIFFVISGYLITTIIVRDIQSDEFSISKFYERRFRRLLPALAVVVVCSVVVGSILLTPNAVLDLGQSAVATALFSSNILFYLESGYFDVAAEMKPLLHTWSLAVEEQYYIFFPLLLLLIAKIDPKGYLKWLIILSIVSFVACIVVTQADASAAFYLLPTRAWELLIGSLLALHIVPSPDKRSVRELYSVVGILMIGYSIFQFSSETNFPGVAAIVPTVGAALIILSGSGGVSSVCSLLSLWPLTFLGAISYSLYLWHWPVLVYTKIFLIKEPSAPAIVMMLLLILLLSIISWKYIESPFRKKTLFKNRRPLFWASAIVSLVIILMGFTLILGDGFPRRAGIDMAQAADLDEERWRYWNACEEVSGRDNASLDLCNIGTRSGGASFILWGDSHARAIASGLELIAKYHNLNGVIATQSACPPLLSIDRPNRTSCSNFNDRILEYLSESTEIDTVILAARWALSVKGSRYKSESGETVRLVHIGSTDSRDLSNVELFKTGLISTIEKILELNKKVILVGPVPEIGYDVPSAHLVTRMTGREINLVVSPSVEEFRERNEAVMAVFHELEGRFAINVINPQDYLCDVAYCNVTYEGNLLYVDDNHLSTYGSEYISEAFDAIF